MSLHRLSKSVSWSYGKQNIPFPKKCGATSDLLRVGAALHSTEASSNLKVVFMTPS